MAKTDQSDDLKEMVRCVQLYYRHNQQQSEIAEQLGLTASRVSRLLKRAQEEGLFTVKFNFPFLFEAAATLAEKFGLRDAVVIPTGEPSDLKEELGISAARYFEKSVGRGARVGLSCGNTLFYLVKNLQEGLLHELHIYPLAAEHALKSVDILPNTLVGMMTAKYRPDAIGYALPGQFVSALDGGALSRQAFLNNPIIRRIYDEAQDADVALVGIGGLDSSAPGFCALAAEQGITAKKLKRLGAVGEFNYQPIDADGRLLSTPELAPILQRIISVSVERLQELSQEHGKLVIGIGGGAEKVPAIRAVLAGRVCNVLVTDSDTAKILL